MNSIHSLKIDPQGPQSCAHDVQGPQSHGQQSQHHGKQSGTGGSLGFRAYQMIPVVIAKTQVAKYDPKGRMEGGISLENLGGYLFSAARGSIKEGYELSQGKKAKVIANQTENGGHEVEEKPCSAVRLLRFTCPLQRQKGCSSSAGRAQG